MTLRLLMVVATVLFAACGAPNDGASCSTKPFGVLTGTQCDGGALGPFTFSSDGGVVWEQASKFPCTQDWKGCELMMLCELGSNSYTFELKPTPNETRLSGQMHYGSSSTCVVLAK